MSPRIYSVSLFVFRIWHAFIKLVRMFFFFFDREGKKPLVWNVPLQRPIMVRTICYFISKKNSHIRANAWGSEQRQSNCSVRWLEVSDWGRGRLLSRVAAHLACQWRESCNYASFIHKCLSVTFKWGVHDLHQFDPNVQYVWRRCMNVFSRQTAHLGELFTLSQSRRVKPKSHRCIFYCS